MQYITTTCEETIAIGEKMASILTGGDIVILKGDLGAGKTSFTKGVAKGLGVTDTITSPTFSIMNVYDFPKGNLIHIDTYRIENEEDLIEIGIEEYLGERNTICVIEWPEKIPNLLKEKEPLVVTLTHEKENTRIITIAE